MQIDASTISALLVRAKEFEVLPDIEAQKKEFENFWSDFSANPDVSGFTKELQAETYRVCGKFLCVHGKAIGSPDFQERGKDMLTRAVKMFRALGNEDKASEAACQIAFSYLLDGRTDNSEDVLNESLTHEIELADAQLTDIKINQIYVFMENKQFDLCPPLFDYLKSVIDNCEIRLQLSFLNAVGLYAQYGERRFTESAQYFSTAVRLAVAHDNQRVAAQSYNNLASAYSADGKHYKALKTVGQAIQIAESLNETGWLASYCDTKANIELALGDADAALVSIERSLDYFSGNEEGGFYQESVETKAKILLVLREKSKAVSDTIIKIPHLKNQEIINFPDGCKLFFVPASKARILNFNTDIVVAVRPFENNNPVIVMLKESGEYLMGNLVSEKISFEGDSFEIYLLSDGQGNDIPVSPEDAVISGHVCAVAEYSNELIFENI